MTWEWVALISFVIIAILIVVFRNTSFVKKNWKYFLILAPLAIFIFIRILSGTKKDPASADNPRDDLDESLDKLKDKLEEVQMETAIEVSAAKTKNEEVLKQLEEVKAIEDKSERRKRLAAMIG